MSKLTAAFAHARALPLFVGTVDAEVDDADPVPVTALEDLCAVVLHATNDAGTNPTLAAKVQHADAEDGDFEDVPGGAFEALDDQDSLQVLTLNAAALKPWVKIYFGAPGGTDNPAYTAAASLLGVDKVRG